MSFNLLRGQNPTGTIDFLSAVLHVHVVLGKYFNLAGKGHKIGTPNNTHTSLNT